MLPSAGACIVLSSNWIRLATDCALARCGRATGNAASPIAAARRNSRLFEIIKGVLLVSCDSSNRQLQFRAPVETEVAVVRMKLSARWENASDYPKELA